MIQPDTQSAVRPKSQSTSSNIRTNGLKHDYKNKNVIFYEICSNWAKIYKPKENLRPNSAYYHLEIDFGLLVWV